MPKSLSGRCLCGAITYEASGDPQIVAHCYCVDCRKSSGTGHGTHVMMPEGVVSVSGDLKLYDRPADSGNVVSRGFCGNCASPILSKNSAMAGMVFLRASSLDDPNAVSPSISVYASRAPKWDQVDDALPAFAEMPDGGPKAAMKAAPKAELD